MDSLWLLNSELRVLTTEGGMPWSLMLTEIPCGTGMFRTYRVHSNNSKYILQGFYCAKCFHLIFQFELHFIPGRRNVMPY